MARTIENIQNEVLRLASQAWPFPDEPMPSGTQDSEIDAFAERIGISMPDELRAWLCHCNGAAIGPGGVYGVIEMEQVYSWQPAWIKKGWIAVADDGCGDLYVLDTHTMLGHTHPVYFIDHETYEEEANYIVASGLWVFLRFLLAKDVEHQKAYEHGQKYASYWPFDEHRVLAEDPLLADYKGRVPLPWKAD